MCSGCNWENSLELCEQIVEDCDDVPGHKMEIAEDIQEKVNGIWQWIEDNEHVTLRQENALKSWAEAIERIRN